MNTRKATPEQISSMKKSQEELRAEGYFARIQEHMGTFMVTFWTLSTENRIRLGRPEYFVTLQAAVDFVAKEVDGLLESRANDCTLGRPGNPEFPQDCLSDFGQSRVV